jgi:hypothetical protein
MVNRADHAAAVFTDRARDPMPADILGVANRIYRIPGALDARRADLLSNAYGVREPDVKGPAQKGGRVRMSKRGSSGSPRGSSTLRGREAGTGQFIPVKEARQRPNTTTVERVPKPGQGADSSSPRGRDARTGEFIPVKEAQRRPGTTVIERIPNPGKG